MWGPRKLTLKLLYMLTIVSTVTTYIRWILLFIRFVQEVSHTFKVIILQNNLFLSICKSTAPMAQFSMNVLILTCLAMF